jgi:hypothetical protein
MGEIMVEGLGRVQIAGSAPTAEEAAAIAKGAQPSSSRGPLSGAIDAAKYIDNLVRQAAQGVTLDYADEISAGISTLGGLVGDYGAALGEERGRDETFREENPVAATTAQIAGGIGGAVAAAPAVGAALGTRALANVPRWLQAAGIGAGAGAAAGFGQGEGGVENRLESAAYGSGLGLGAGLVFPVVLNALAKHGKAAVQPLIQRFSNAPAGMTITPAIRQILVRLERDQMTPDQAIEQLRRLGPEAGIADVGGENMLSLARGVAQRVPGREAAGTFYSERNVGTGQRVLNDLLDGLTGGDPRFHQRIEALSAQRAADARPLYDQAYKADIEISPRLRSLLDRPAIGQAFDLARDIARNEGVELPEVFITRQLPNGDVDIQLREVPDMQTWDYIKRGLDDVIDASRDSITGRLDNAGRAVDSIRRTLLNELDSMNPVYAKARAAWSGPSQVMDAMAEGRKFVRGEADEVAANWAKVPEADREFYRLGAAQELKAMIEAVPDGRDLFNRLWGNEAMRRRLTTIFGDQDALARFAQTVKAEHTMRQNANVAAPRAGSQTTPRLIDDATLAQDAMGAATESGNALMALLNLQFGTAVGRAASFVGRRVTDPARSNDRAASELAPVLFSNNQMQNEALLRSLEQSRLNRLMSPSFTAGAAVGGGNITVNQLAP